MYATSGPFHAQTEHAVHIGGDANEVVVQIINNVTGQAYQAGSISVHDLRKGIPAFHQTGEGVFRSYASNWVLELFSQGISDELRGRYPNSAR